MKQVYTSLLVSLDFAPWKLQQVLHWMCGQMKIKNSTYTNGNQTEDLLATRPALYLTTKDFTHYQMTNFRLVQTEQIAEDILKCM